MPRRIIIEAVTSHASEHATLVLRAADKDRTPLLKIRVNSADIRAALTTDAEHNNARNDVIDAELVS